MSTGLSARRFPIIGAGELPFLMSTPGRLDALDAWYRKYAEKEMKDVSSAWPSSTRPRRFTRAPKDRVPDDVKGMKIRPAHATMANS